MLVMVEQDKKGVSNKMETNIILTIRTKTSDYEIDVDKTLEDIENGSTWSFSVSNIETFSIRKKEN